MYALSVSGAVNTQDLCGLKNKTNKQTKTKNKKEYAPYIHFHSII